MKIIRTLPLVLIATAAFAQNQVGDFSVAGGKFTAESSPATIIWTLTGQPATIKSRQKVRELELSAQKLTAITARTGNYKDQLTNATLVGNSRVRIVELSTGTIDIVTAEKVVYKVGATKGSGHADLIGKTTWKRVDKARQPIWSFSGENGTIDFEGDTQKISLDNLDGNITPPPSKEKGKS